MVSTVMSSSGTGAEFVVNVPPTASEYELGYMQQFCGDDECEAHIQHNAKKAPKPSLRFSIGSRMTKASVRDSKASFTAAPSASRSVAHTE